MLKYCHETINSVIWIWLILQDASVASQDNEDHAFDINAEPEPIPEADHENEDMPDMAGDFPDNDYAGTDQFPKYQQLSIDSRESLDYQ